VSSSPLSPDEPSSPSEELSRLTESVRKRSREGLGTKHGSSRFPRRATYTVLFTISGFPSTYSSALANTTSFVPFMGRSSVGPSLMLIR